MNDRDTFAAAALTGLLASPEGPIDSREAAHYCYRIADAMLAARGDALRPADAAYTQGVSASDASKNHDAAPAAVPVEAATGEVHEGGAPSGTGDTRAWRRSGNYHRLVDAADRYAQGDPGPRAGERMDRLCDVVDQIVGGYAAPPAGSVRLTDAERRELEAAASDYESGAEKIVYGFHAYRRRAATIRGLVARATKEGGR